MVKGGGNGLQGESGEVMEFAMTCNHVASPSDMNNKDSSDKYGIGLSSGTPVLSPITMLCPSPVDETETRSVFLERPGRESLGGSEEKKRSLLLVRLSMPLETDDVRISGLVLNGHSSHLPNLPIHSGTDP